jgi:nucleotide sugar dehydrogenase
MKQIAIIGYGYVGKAMAHFFKEHYEVIIYDPYIEDESEIKNNGVILSEDKSRINNCDLGVVCVPTPMGDNNECDLTLVNDTLTWLDTPLILLKSTVEIGTTDRLKTEYNKRIVFSPEYVGESSYFTPSPYDFHKEIVQTPWFTFGGDKADTTAMIDIFLPVSGPCKEYIQCSASEAEMAKYMANTFFATKIMFMYEMERICTATNVDFNSVRELWLKDTRINPMHTAVFTHKTKDECFGGKCFPKDINALIEASKKNGYIPKLLEEVRDSNNRVGKLLHDETKGIK